jgi:hypothetical protein
VLVAGLNFECVVARVSPIGSRIFVFDFSSNSSTNIYHQFFVLQLICLIVMLRFVCIARQICKNMSSRHPMIIIV